MKACTKNEVTKFEVKTYAKYVHCVKNPTPKINTYLVLGARIHKNLFASVVHGPRLQALIVVAICVLLDANGTSLARSVLPAAVDGLAVLGHLGACAATAAKLGDHQVSWGALLDDVSGLADELATVGLAWVGFALAFVDGLAIGAD